MSLNMRDKLLTKNPWSLMLELAVPAVIGMLVLGLYPLMDGVFAGHIIGQAAMTACGVAMPLTFINGGISTLIGVGSASILSRALGKGDRATVDKIMGNLIFWVILFSVVITAGGILLAPAFMDLVGAGGEIRALGVRYLRVLFWGSFFVNFTQASNMVMRGEGLMKRAMAIMAFGGLLNIVLDPIFMIGMGPRAIEGAAIATVIAQAAQAALTLYYFRRKSEQVQIGRLGRDAVISKEMFAVGVSAMVMQVLFLIQQTVLYRQAFHYGGAEFGTMMAATLRIFGFSFLPLWGMSQGLQPMVGTNFGAGKMDRVAAGMRVFCIGSLILAAVFWVPAQFFPALLLRAFNVSPAIIAANVVYFRMFYSIFILYGVMVMVITYFQSIGDGKRAGQIVMLRQLILFVPAMFLLPMVCGKSAVWWAEPLVDGVMIMVSLGMCVASVRRLEARPSQPR